MKKKKPYKKPALKSEKIFETAALACGKRKGTVTHQGACTSLKTNS